MLLQTGHIFERLTKGLGEFLVKARFKVEGRSAVTQQEAYEWPSYGVNGAFPDEMVPEPSPIDPHRLPPTVLHVPAKDVEEFRATIVARYLSQLATEAPRQLLHSMQHPHLQSITDAEFVRIIEDTPFSRFLNPTLDPKDLDFFAPILAQRDPEGAGQLFKVDFSLMERLERLEGIHTAATVTLFEHVEGKPTQAVAIRIGDLLLTPNDGAAWELARYFVLQGAHLCMVLCVHPRLHFPFDCVNALTATELLEGHVLRELLMPHFYNHLPLNYGVLYSDRSVAHNHQKEPYSPFPCTREGNFESIAIGYDGLEGNSSFPKFRFRMGDPEVHSDYGVFLVAYYAVLRRHVTRVLAHVDAANDPHVAQWADRIASMLPGFPDAREIAKPGVLVEAVTTIIGSVALEHSTDHHAYSRESVNTIPWRLRVPAPTSADIAPLDYRRLVLREDIFRHRMCRLMFFESVTTRRLVDVEYNFPNTEMAGLTAVFQQELRDLDANLPTRRFIPLEEIAVSLQF